MTAFFNVEDIHGSVEIIVFPKDYEKYRAVIVEDEKVFVRGRVSVNENEGGKVICESITTFDNIPSELWLRFENKEQYSNLIGQIENTCAQSDGNDKVIIYLKEEKQKKVLPPSKNVKADGELQERLKELIGADNVVVV